MCLDINILYISLQCRKSCRIKISSINIKLIFSIPFSLSLRVKTFFVLGRGKVSPLITHLPPPPGKKGERRGSRLDEHNDSNDYYGSFMSLLRLRQLFSFFSFLFGNFSFPPRYGFFFVLFSSSFSFKRDDLITASSQLHIFLIYIFRLFFFFLSAPLPSPPQRKKKRGK